MKSAAQPGPRTTAARPFGGWTMTLLRQLFLVGGSLLAIYPVYYMAVTAFKTRPDWLHNQFGLPNPFTAR